MFGLFGKKTRRDTLKAQPFPPEHLAILERTVPIYRGLCPEDQSELQGHIQVFLDEKTFEGCDGQEINDEIKVTVAAQACLLLLHRETDYYPKLYSVLVYPSTYVAKYKDQWSMPGLVVEGEEGRFGESWHAGTVVLAWDSVKMGAADMRDGQNVVLHEFAHQLDQEDGTADGAPVLPQRAMYSAWARVLGEEYEQLRNDSEKGRKTVLDQYGATKPAEFFAVATECFFEKPTKLKKKHPELYEELMLYYQQDPESIVRT